MKIRKVYEMEEQSQMAKDTLTEMLDKISETSETFDSNKKTLISLSETLSNFLSSSKTTNNQLDDAYLNLKTIETKISDILSLLDTTNKQLKDYYDSGEKFIY